MNKEERLAFKPISEDLTKFFKFYQEKIQPLIREEFHKNNHISNMSVCIGLGVISQQHARLTGLGIKEQKEAVDFMSKHFEHAFATDAIVNKTP